AKKREWPEFAELDCYACHHDIRNPGVKQDLTFPGHKAGQLTCNPWATSNAGLAFSLLGGNRDSFDSMLRDVESEAMKPRPATAILEQKVAVLVKKIDVALERESNPIIPIRGTMAALAKLRPQTWDDAAQVYSGLAALEKARIDQGQSEFPGLR